MLPADPKNRPDLIASIIETLGTNHDHIVVAEHDPRLAAGTARTDNLDKMTLDALAVSLFQASLSRVMASRTGAIPPYFALEDTKDGHRLTLYIALGSLGKPLPASTIARDLGSLAEILKISEVQRVWLPKSLLARIGLNRDGSPWRLFTVVELQAAADWLSHASF